MGAGYHDWSCLLLWIMRHKKTLVADKAFQCPLYICVFTHKKAPVADQASRHSSFLFVGSIIAILARRPSQDKGNLLHNSTSFQRRMRLRIQITGETIRYSIVRIAAFCQTLPACDHCSLGSIKLFCMWMDSFTPKKAAREVSVCCQKRSSP